MAFLSNSLDAVIGDGASSQVFVVRDVKAGEVFTRENVRCIRPGYGMAPRHLEEIVGRRAAMDVAAMDLLQARVQRSPPHGLGR